MKNKIIKIPEFLAVNSLKEYIDGCDSDEIARLLGEIFGGECFVNTDDPEVYDFKPNEYYSGEFNNLKKG